MTDTETQPEDRTVEITLRCAVTIPAGTAFKYDALGRPVGFVLPNGATVSPLFAVEVGAPTGEPESYTDYSKESEITSATGIELFDYVGVTIEEDDSSGDPSQY
jgi:YD repeat-containing protein